ncbi:MAG: hypothetical protein ABEK50_04770 [bacterium]
MEWMIVGNTDFTTAMSMILKRKGIRVGGNKPGLPQVGQLTKESLVVVDIDAFSFDELLSHLINHEQRYSNIDIVFVTSESEH